MIKILNQIKTLSDFCKLYQNTCIEYLSERAVDEKISKKYLIILKLKENYAITIIVYH